MPVLNILGKGLPLRNLIVNGSSSSDRIYTLIHGYVQSADTLASNTRALKDKLSDIATLHYVDGPPMRDNSTSSSRPWWILGKNLEHKVSASGRWDDSVCYYSNNLNGIIFWRIEADWM
jgi:Serine hydrolase (FSH1)